jgi:hypothetical protein
LAACYGTVTMRDEHFSAAAAVPLRFVCSAVQRLGNETISLARQIFLPQALSLDADRMRRLGGHKTGHTRNFVTLLFRCVTGQIPPQSLGPAV